MRESGIEELRGLVRLANNTRESAFDGFTAEECFLLLRACRDSDWDITPDELRSDERQYAAENGKIHKRTHTRLERERG